MIIGVTGESSLCCWKMFFVDLCDAAVGSLPPGGSDRVPNRLFTNHLQTRLDELN